MANVDGDWDIVMRTPMGDQQAVLTVRSDGETTVFFLMNFGDGEAFVPLGATMLNLSSGEQVSDVTLERYGAVVLKS